MLSTCKHPNIVNFFKCYSKGDELCFLLELCENGTLSDYLRNNKNLSQANIKYFTASILNGLEYMHNKGIVHRDIKPLNILLDSELNVKITDFGTAKLLNCKDEKVNRALQKRTKREESRSSSPCKKNSFVGTNEYITPEVLKGQTPTCAIDLWSLGVILYRMYSGFTPFVGDNEMETYENICKGEFSKHSDIPSEALSLIKSLLKVNPSERIGCSKS